MRKAMNRKGLAGGSKTGLRGNEEEAGCQEAIERDPIHTIDGTIT